MLSCEATASPEISPFLALKVSGERSQLDGGCTGPGEA